MCSNWSGSQLRLRLCCVIVDGGFFKLAVTVEQRITEPWSPFQFHLPLATMKIAQKTLLVDNFQRGNTMVFCLRGTSPKSKGLTVSAELNQMTQVTLAGIIGSAGASQTFPQFIKYQWVRFHRFFVLFVHSLTQELGRQSKTC